MASEQGNESEIRQKVAELPGRNRKCDVVFQVGDYSFLARKDVLKLRMEYFRGMFTANMQEKDQTFIKLDPEIVDPEMFDELLDYIYTFQIDFTTDNLQSIYKAADFFCFDELKAKTEIFMKNNLRKDNVSLFLDIAMKFDLKDQEERCKQFIISNPLVLIKTRHEMDFLNYSELSSVLQKLAELGKFEDMFHSSIEWILCDKRNRSKRISELLEMIPLRRLSPDFCKQIILKNIIVKNDNKCLQFLVESFIDTPPVEEIYVFGGKNGTELSSMSKYDSSTRNWVEYSPMQAKLTHFACAVVNQNIYVCGGNNGQKDVNELLMLNTNTHQWSTLKTMKYPRQGCAMTVLGCHLYVAGGWDQENKLSAVERYSIHNDEWRDVSPMIHKRHGLELVQMNGFLYALGGHDGTNPVQSVEQYNPLTDKWTLVANMNHYYGWFGSVAINDRIYVLGKYAFEEYNMQENKWRVMASPTECENGRRLAAFDGKLYAIGGRIGDVKDWKGKSTVEYYDFQKQTWITTKNMNIARSYHCVAVVTRKYTPE